jgi:hypothetical protein
MGHPLSEEHAKEAKVVSFRPCGASAGGCAAGCEEGEACLVFSLVSERDDGKFKKWRVLKPGEVAKVYGTACLCGHKSTNGPKC